ncbi:MAG TPA: alanine racemase [Acidobacteriaceae bacterium]|nr:alanine racemase [Acidobacteriaceae bacterium]
MQKSEIPTPALLVDMDAMEANIKHMADFFAEGPCRLRPHYKNYKCVALSRRQLANGAIGITCATLGEAEALARNGIQSILLANEIADPVQIERFIQLARVTDIMVGIDNERAITAMSKASADANVPLSVVVDVDTGMGRCGVPPGAPALALAQLATTQGLRVRGLIGYEGHCVRLPPGPAKVEAIHKAMGPLVETAKLLRSHGIAADIVSAGGTGTHAVSGRFPGITEIQGGSYMLMDTDYQTVCPEFKLALSVLGTVISRTGNERLILNIGLKEISAERGLPVLKNAEGARLRKLNAEHAIVDITDPGFPAQVGDRLEIWAHYSDATVNLHRRMFGIRGERVEETFLFES